jgi:hypothetical protein
MVERCSEQAWWLNFRRVRKGDGLLKFSLFVEGIPGEIVFITVTISYNFGWRNDNEIRRNKIIMRCEGQKARIQGGLCFSLSKDVMVMKVSMSKYVS